MSGPIVVPQAQGPYSRAANSAVHLATGYLIIFWSMRVVLFFARAFASLVRPILYGLFGIVEHDETSPPRGRHAGRPAVEEEQPPRLPWMPDDTPAPAADMPDAPVRTHGAEGSGVYEEDGWEIPAWQINVYAALKGLGWTDELAHEGVVFAAPLADQGIYDEPTLLRRALRVGD